MIELMINHTNGDALRDIEVHLDRDALKKDRVTT